MLCWTVFLEMLPERQRLGQGFVRNLALHSFLD
jgi:hypothetical protein